MEELSNITFLAKIIPFNAKKSIEKKAIKPKQEKVVVKKALDKIIEPYLTNMINKGLIDYYQLRSKIDNYLSETERKVLTFILQKTIKFKNGISFISYGEFVNGVRRGNEIYLEGLGYDVKTIRKAIDSLVQRKVILKYRFNSYSSYLYLLNVSKSREIYYQILEGNLSYYDCEQINLLVKRGKSFFEIQIEDVKVKNKAPESKNDNDKLVKMLTESSFKGEKINFNEKIARSLISSYEDKKLLEEIIKNQINWLPYRKNIQNADKAAVLYNCIKENRSCPVELIEKSETKEVSKDDKSKEYIKALSIWDLNNGYKEITVNNAKFILNQLILSIYKSVKSVTNNYQKTKESIKFLNKIHETLKIMPLEKCFLDETINNKPELIEDIYSLYEQEKNMLDLFKIED